MSMATLVTDDVEQVFPVQLFVLLLHPVPVAAVSEKSLILSRQNGNGIAVLPTDILAIRFLCFKQF